MNILINIRELYCSILNTLIIYYYSSSIANYSKFTPSINGLVIIGGVVTNLQMQ